VTSYVFLHVLNLKISQMTFPTDRKRQLCEKIIVITTYTEKGDSLQPPHNYLTIATVNINTFC